MEQNPKVGITGWPSILQCVFQHVQAISGAKCWILFPMGSLQPTVRFTATSLTAYMCCDICSCGLEYVHGNIYKDWKHLGENPRSLPGPNWYLILY